MVFASKAKEEFNIKPISSPAMERFITECSNIYKGNPAWLDADDGIRTVNFARFICSETAKLSTLGMTVKIEGDSDRVKRIQKQIDEAKHNFRNWIEYAGAYGTIILKPNGESIDCVLPSDYLVTEQKNGNITGVVFFNHDVSADGNTYYTRLEYHRWVNGLYCITNKCYKGSSRQDMDKVVDIKDTPWNMLDEEVFIQNINTPLYGVLKMPSANSIDVDSPLSMPVFAEAIEELKDLDIAYSRNASEIFGSDRIVLLDSDRLAPQRGAFFNTIEGRNVTAQSMKLPKYVRMIEGTGDSADIYHEINPALATETRLAGINSLLSQIGFKCGFSNGYFVFNESTGFATATQVTADQARTIQLIEDIRKKIDACMIDLIKALNTFEDLYGTTGHLVIEDTVSTDELDRIIHLHFEPIYTNKEEDRMRALQLTNSGYYPKWYYLHLYEGLSEEEAKALTEEAMPKDAGLFDE